MHDVVVCFCFDTLMNVYDINAVVFFMSFLLGLSCSQSNSLIGYPAAET